MVSRSAKPRDLGQELNDLKADVRRLMTGALSRPALRVTDGDFPVAGGGSVTVSDGGGLVVEDGGSVSVEDSSGDPQVRMGALSGGGFGLEQIIGSDWVPLAALAGGAVANYKSTTVDLDTTGSGDTGFTGTDLSVSFKSYTGKYILIVSAGRALVANGTAYMGYTVSGAQTIPATSTRTAALSASGFVISSNTHIEVRTGSPGDMTLTAKYGLTGSGSGSATGAWSNRAVVVLPF